MKKKLKICEPKLGWMFDRRCRCFTAGNSLIGCGVMWSDTGSAWEANAVFGGESSGSSLIDDLDEAKVQAEDLLFEMMNK